MKRHKWPSLQRLESAVERQIREAMEAGEFDDLAGAGQPLPGLDGPHDELWWAKKKLLEEGVSWLPEALELRAEVERGLAKLERCRSEQKVREILEDLNSRIRKLNATNTAGPGSSLAPIDVDGAIERWRERSCG